MESASCTGPVHYRTAAVGGVSVFYREAGPGSGPVVLLLHCFPSSSRMFRDLIPRLSDAYRVIAPDYPAFGHSGVPGRSAFGYTFGHLADVVDGLLGQLGIGKFAIYVMDFGAAVGFRLALRHPGRLSAIIVQNAPLYPWEPLGWWATLGRYWADGSAGHRHAARSYLDQDALRGQYLSGDIHFQLVAELLDGDELQWPEYTDARVVHQAGQSGLTDMLANGFGGRGDLPGVGDVEQQRRYLARRGRGDRHPVRGLADAGVDVVAACGQAQGGGPPDSRRGPGDQHVEARAIAHDSSL
jgi:pimeloyl-ACP methyl ester carboxylesterase